MKTKKQKPKKLTVNSFAKLDQLIKQSKNDRKVNTTSNKNPR